MNKGSGPLDQRSTKQLKSAAIHTSICMELHFGMGWMWFDHSKSGLLAADWTRFLDDVLNPHVTSFHPTCSGESDGRPNGSH